MLRKITSLGTPWEERTTGETRSGKLDETVRKAARYNRYWNLVV
jgi:hypothetical protein